MTSRTSYDSYDSLSRVKIHEKCRVLEYMLVYLQCSNLNYKS